MLNRRLIVLFLLFLAAALILSLRLAKLQLLEAAHWQQEMRAFVHRPRVIETYRGQIEDRFGTVLARDVPCDELAIDYRAMNKDDRWLTAMARARLDASGEKIPDRAARLERIARIKGQIADQIDAIPEAVSRVCQIPTEEVYRRFNDIRARIIALRQDLWSRAYQRNPAPGDMPDPGELDADYRDVQIKEEIISHTIVSPLSPEAAAYFRRNAGDFPGLIVRDNANRRDYPYGPVAAHVVGAMGNVSAMRLVDAQGNVIFDPLGEHPFKLPNLLADNDPGNLAGYLPGDRAGETGAERMFEPLLRGAAGVRLVDLSASGDGQTAEQSRRVDPIPGKDLRLTIDIGLQQDLYNALTDPTLHLLQGEDKADHFAAVVVLSLDGQILAMVSLPTYDPNAPDEQRHRLNTDHFRTPLLNRVTNATYQPGSTIKPIVAAAALSENVITPERTITCIGYLYPNRPDAYRCDKRDGHGPMQLVNAIAESCDVYFYTVGRDMGLERLTRWYGLFGFGGGVSPQLSEARGQIPDLRHPMAPDEATYESIFLGMGQGKITATPLQMANAYGTLLRGGAVIPPHILADTPETHTQAFQLSPEFLGVIRRGMREAVTAGTARDAFRGFRLSVAGKTGTAQKSRDAYDDDGRPIPDLSKPLLNPDGTPRVGPDGQRLYRQARVDGDDAWFVGYAPADQPKFIVAAIMEFGGHGGAHAAPIVREAFTLLQKHDYLPHTDVP